MLRLIICLSLFGGLFTSQAFAAGTIVVSEEEVPGEVVVKFKNHLRHSATLKAMARLQGRVRVHSSSQQLNVHHLKISDGSNHHDIINALNMDPGVQYAEPNYVVHFVQDRSLDNRVLSAADVQIMSGPSIQGGASPSYIQSSANIKLTQAWSIIGTPSNIPVVAVVDTGVDYNHYVLTGASALWKNTREIANNGVDDDGNGFIDDVNGWNFNAGNNNPMDDNGHGTHVAGIIIGAGQDIFASSLVASKIKVMPLKFMDASGNGTTAAAIQAIDYAVNNGAKVINNSWGGSSYSQGLHDALAYAYGRGIVIASAAGNYASNDDTNLIYPASLPVPSQISVAASDDSDVLASFSSYGKNTVQLSSPGVTILSTYPNNSFAYLSGTSMATPLVAGLAALAMIEAPQLTGYQVKNIMMQSTDLISNLNGLVSTSGRVNALSTIQTSLANNRTPASQPSYQAIAPPGVTDASAGTTTASSSSGGCGLVAAGASQFFGTGGPGASALVVILMLPLFVWLIVHHRITVGRGRRRFDRFVLNSEMRLLVGGRELTGKVNTIGLGGLSFSAEALLEKGGTVTMSVAGPDGKEQIQVEGRIVWSENSHAYGVQFAPTSESVIEQISRWTGSLVKSTR